MEPDARMTATRQKGADHALEGKPCTSFTVVPVVADQGIDPRQDEGFGNAERQPAGENDAQGLQKHRYRAKHAVGERRPHE